MISRKVAKRNSKEAKRLLMSEFPFASSRVFASLREIKLTLLRQQEL
jgi:hypothetical protein